MEKASGNQHWATFMLSPPKGCVRDADFVRYVSGNEIESYRASVEGYVLVRSRPQRHSRIQLCYWYPKNFTQCLSRDDYFELKGIQLLTGNSYLYRYNGIYYAFKYFKFLFISGAVCLTTHNSDPNL